MKRRLQAASRRSALGEVHAPDAERRRSDRPSGTESYGWRRSLEMKRDVMTKDEERYGPNGAGDTAVETRSVGAARTDERRLPFSQRVAMEWFDAGDLPGDEDGHLRHWRRAPLTGNVMSTSAGRDVSFSDLEVL